MIVQKLFNYRPQRSWAKVIFSQACVCPQGGRGVCLSACWDTHPPRAGTSPPEQTPPWTKHPPRADTSPSRHPRSRHPPEQTPQSRHPPREQTPPGADTPPGKQTPAYGLRAAGTHPTGMHSCFIVFLCLYLETNYF